MRGITKDDALAGNPVFDVLGKTRNDWFVSPLAPSRPVT